MPATTKNLKIPYPTGGDPVRDGPQTFQEAMQLIDEMLTALTVTKLPTPRLTDGVTSGGNSFEIYRQGNLIIFQGWLNVAKNLSTNRLFAEPLPEEIRPLHDLWFPSNVYTNAKNLLLTSDGYLQGRVGDTKFPLSTGWYELGAVKYVIDPAQESTTTNQGVTQ